MQSEVLSSRFDVHRVVTEKIISAIEAGAGAFEMPWHRSGRAIGRPANALSGAPYRGVNVVALWAESMLTGLSSGWWATFNQWRELDARVRRGEHGTTIVFYKSLSGPADNHNDPDDQTPRFVARAHRVFNQLQVDGWEPPDAPQGDKTQVLESVEVFVGATEAKVRHGGDVACYRPHLDLIDMPPRAAFRETRGSSPTEAYYATLLHELTHWSGAPRRLERDLAGRFGTEAYAMEELVAELGAAFLCSDLGISNEPRPDHAAYLSSWLSVLKSDRRAIFAAARLATEASAYLRSFSFGEPPF